MRRGGSDNRNATIAGNVASRIGNNAFAAWGATGTCLNANCSRALRCALAGRVGTPPPPLLPPGL